VGLAQRLPEIVSRRHAANAGADHHDVGHVVLRTGMSMFQPAPADRSPR
jgi:hypothetical protein